MKIEIWLHKTYRWHQVWDSKKKYELPVTGFAERNIELPSCKGHCYQITSMKRIWTMVLWRYKLYSCIGVLQYH